MVVTPRIARKDPITMTNIIADRGITMATTVPSQNSAWLHYGNIDKLLSSSLTWLLSGGEAMGFPVIQLFQQLNKPDLRLLNIYGPTEVMVPTMHEVPYRELTAADMLLPIGAMRPNYSAYVADEPAICRNARVHWFWRCWCGHGIHQQSNFKGGKVPLAQVSIATLPSPRMDTCLSDWRSCLLAPMTFKSKFVVSG